MSAVVVRRLGSGTTHVAEVPESAMFSGVIFGAPCTLVDDPVAGRCGAALRGKIVAMREGAPVYCRACRAITGRSS